MLALAGGASWNSLDRKALTSGSSLSPSDSILTKYNNDLYT